MANGNGKTYFVIQYNNGITLINQYDRIALLAALDDNTIDGSKIVDVIPGIDVSSWPNETVVIIGGKIVKVQGEEVVTKYKIIDEPEI